ncbi:hypothetical protein GCM10029964_028680 [Kibdelosporangium lantanae]
MKSNADGRLWSMLPSLTIARMCGEHLRVLLAHQRAVGEAKVVQLLLAERGTYGVDVARGGPGVEVVDQRTAVLTAALDVLPVEHGQLVELGLAGRPLGGEHLVVERVVAQQLLAGVDAARVEPDDVEPLGDRRRDPVAVQDVVHPGAAGAARVEDQRAQPVRRVLRPDPGDPDVRLLPLGADQSIGTATVPHSTSGLLGQGCQLIADTW